MSIRGGYKTITITQLGNLLHALKTGEITWLAARVWFAGLEMVAIREAAARLAGAQQDIERDHDAGAAARAQAGLAERVHDTTQSAQRLLQRLKRNRLQENALSDALREASHAWELAIIYFSLIFVGPGKYSVDRE